MPEVSVEIAGRPYRLGCDEGQQEHLAGLAAILDAEASVLAKQFSQIPEGRLMLMTALVIADKLHDAKGRMAEKDRLLTEARQAAESRDSQPDMFGPEQQERLARRINMLAERVEAAAGAH